MKNLKPLECNYLDVYKRIAISRNSASDAGVIAKNQTALSARISDYLGNCYSLEKVIQRSWDCETTETLISLFKKKCRISDELKRDIKKLSFSGRCPYCGIGETNSVEHYLPLKKYPEFSVLTLNLLPVCSMCNSYKNDTLVDISGNRTTINFYYDPIDSERFLHCEIIYENDVPVPYFNIDPKINSPINPIIKNHFNRLSLSSRYTSSSNEQISDIRRNIKSILKHHPEDENLDKIKAILLDYSDGWILDHGKNYWRVALIEALSKSDRFITESMNEE